MKYLSKIVEYGLYLLVFFLPIQTRWIIRQGILNNGPWEYGTYSLYAADIMLIIVLLLFIIQRLSEKRILNFEFRIKNLIQNTKYQIQNLLIFGLILVSGISVFFAPNKVLALYKFGWLILGIGLFWLIRSASYDKAKIIYALLVGIFLQASLGVWQFLFQATIQNKWLGLALHQSGELGTSVIEAVGSDGIGERWLRAYGGMDHPNVLGGLLAIGLILVINQIIVYEKKFRITNYPPSASLRRTSELRITNKIQNTKLYNTKLIIYYFLLVFFVTALFFSFSRSAWLGWGIGLGLVAVWAIFKKDLVAQKSIAQIILISSTVAMLLFLQYPNLVITRLYAPSRLEIKSTSERVESIKNSWPIIKHHWLVGAGLGNYSLAVRRELRPNEQSYYYQPAHNVFLLVLSETGIAGLLFFLGLIVYLTITNYQLLITNKMSNVKFQIPNLKLEIRNWKLEIGYKNNTKDSIISLSVLAATIVVMSLDHWLWSLHFGVLFFWLILGLANRSPRPEYDSNLGITNRAP